MFFLVQVVDLGICVRIPLVRGAEAAFTMVEETLQFPQLLLRCFNVCSIRRFGHQQHLLDFCLLPLPRHHQCPWQSHVTFPPPNECSHTHILQGFPRVPRLLHPE